MSENVASRIIIDNSRVTIKIVSSITDDSWGTIYNCDMFIVQAIGGQIWLWYVVKFIKTIFLVEQFPLQAWERARHHLVFMQTALSASGS